MRGWENVVQVWWGRWGLRVIRNKNAHTCVHMKFSKN